MQTVEQYMGTAPYDPLATLIEAVLKYGDRVPDRTGTGTLELFGAQLIYNLENNSLPLCVLKKTSFKNVLIELLWLISGRQDLGFMHEQGVRHWDPWIPSDGRYGPNSLGRVYGVQWRNWASVDSLDPCSDSLQPWIVVDQLQEVMNGLAKDPHGRRHLVTAWNPGELDLMALPPCHLLFQCHVSSSNQLSMQVYQRSADLFIGVPYDVGMYAILLRMMCEILGYTPGKLVFCFGSAHVYLNHLEQAQELISREHRPFPTLEFEYPGAKPLTLDHFTPEMFKLVGYNPHPHIKAPVAV